MSRAKTSTLALFVAALLYIAAYAVAWEQRRPAANMAYFVYSDNDTTDRICYRVFYPLDWLHRRLFDSGKHRFDATPMRPDPGNRG